MILSHKHRFIFIKTEKTAGTSLEIALSKYCGPHDVITPLVPEDEQKRAALGYRGAQNYHIPFRRYGAGDVLRAAYRRQRLHFFNHAGASFIRQYVAPEVWKEYFKFAFERNPWDKVVSAYYWNAAWRGLSPSMKGLSEWTQSGHANWIRGFELYSVRNEIVVDRVYRYERLNDSLTDLAGRLDLPEVPVLPRTKAKARKDKRRYSELLSPPDRDKIARMFAREIAYFGYEYEERKADAPRRSQPGSSSRSSTDQ